MKNAPLLPLRSEHGSKSRRTANMGETPMPRKNPKPESLRDAGTAFAARFVHQKKTPRPFGRDVSF